MPVSAHEWVASATIDADPVITAATDFASAIRALAANATTTVRVLSPPPVLAGDVAIASGYAARRDPAG
ncbi:hypothetical protein KAREA_42940 [Prescottella equi]|nr:hypothetical protein RE9414_42310 [Prescottella equi]BDC74379.1 hypothetical protein KAREA_42940 [Prescottella equi]